MATGVQMMDQLFVAERSWSEVCPALCTLPLIGHFQPVEPSSVFATELDCIWHTSRIPLQPTDHRNPPIAVGSPEIAVEAISVFRELAVSGLPRCSCTNPSLLDVSECRNLLGPAFPWATSKLRPLTIVYILPLSLPIFKREVLVKSFIIIIIFFFSLS